MHKARIGNQRWPTSTKVRGRGSLDSRFPDDHEVLADQVPGSSRAGFRFAPDTRGCGNSSIPERVEDYRLSEILRGLAGLPSHRHSDLTSSA